MIAAFFDIDGTLYRNSLMVEHFKKLIKYELLDFKAYNDNVKVPFTQWAERTGDYEKYLLSLTETYKMAIKGLPIEYNDFVADQVVDIKGNRVYTYTRQMIKHHKSLGHKVIFISGSPDFLVSRMAKKFGVDDYCGSEYKVVDGKLSGEIGPMWDHVHKLEAIDRFCEKYNINLSESYAYGDTHGDITMLEKVGNPVAVNPSRELLECIKKDDKLSAKARVIIERKDVIYELSSQISTIDSSYKE